MSGSQLLLLGGTRQVVSDPNFEYTTLLLPGNGTNGAQNNTFLDSSTNAFSITRNGNTTQGTFSPFSQTGWGLYQPTSQSHYVNFTTGAGTLFQFTGDYTIEGWVFLPSIGSDTSVWITSPDSVFYHALNIDATNYNLYLNSGGVTASIAHGLTLNSWNHFAMVRSGSTITMYTNGTSRGTTTNSSTNGYASPILARIGGGAAGTNPRYLSNFRIVKGTAVYTANFTPPSTPLTAISGTSLLTASSNRFNDVAAAGSSPTITGSPSIQAFSPFNPTAAWSAATNGGSGYFDGSGDYLSVPSNAAFAYGTGALTVEAFIYTTTKVDFQSIIGSFDSAGWFLHTTATGVVLAGLNSGTFITGTINVCDGAWHHIAMVRSGSTLTLYIDGVANGAISDSTNVSSTTEVRIGGLSAGLPRPFTGYIGSLRVVKGTAVYTAAFTPPTAPLTAITNTSLLTNFTNAGIYDATSKNDLETVGNAQISTTQSKFGGSSMYFDGTGDYLVTRTTADLQMVNGDFTWECWFRPNSLPGAGQLEVLWSQRASTAAYGGPLIVIDSAGNYLMYVSNAATTNWQIIGTDSGLDASLNTWQHLAIVRYGNSVRIYKDGIAGTSATASEAVGTSGATTVGAGTAAGDQVIDAYMQDVRITKGIARYTSNFTPPTTAFLTL